MQRPTGDDKEAWKLYWSATQLQEWFVTWGYWRTEPEIDQERKTFLLQRIHITPSFEQNLYPFAEVSLSRADLEWLLSMHDNNLGPVNIAKNEQADRIGLDLRGAILRKVDLSGLPLARTRGGISPEEWLNATYAQQEVASIHLEDAILTRVHLEEA